MRSEGAHLVQAPRGTTLTAKSWQTEAPMRMLMNNLDPEVAEQPDDLVVYAGRAERRVPGRLTTRSCARCERWSQMRRCWCSQANPSA